MNILITGANGQLGNEMRTRLCNHKSYNSFFTDKEELDICDINAIDTFFNEHKINLVVNCAAYTAVDKAESDNDLCFLLNATAIGNIAKIANKYDAKVIHISTDYVYDGKTCTPYSENSPTNPKSEYGRTKLAGENALLDNCTNSVIIRTAWLYSEYGNNFVKTMIKLGKDRSELGVIYDQIGTPTYAGDLADAIMSIINSDKFISGIYHFTNEGVCSWFDFAKAIHRISGIKTCKIKPLNTAQYPTPAMRPSYSVLSKDKIKETYNIDIPYWLDSLEYCISQLNNK